MPAIVDGAFAGQSRGHKSAAMAAPEPRPERTLELLRRWNGGDERALHELVERDLGWLQGYVRRRLGAVLRRAGETQDFVHDAMVDVLRYGPRFLVADRDQFRGLVARIVENTLRDRAEHLRAGKRDVLREQAFPSDSVVALDPSLRPVTRPSEAAALEETRAVTRLALELLEPDDRRLILLREYQGLTFADAAQKMGCSLKAAQMRWPRALARLARKIEELYRGELGRALAQAAQEEAGA